MQGGTCLVTAVEDMGTVRSGNASHCWVNSLETVSTLDNVVVGKRSAEDTGERAEYLGVARWQLCTSTKGAFGAKEVCTEQGPHHDSTCTPHCGIPQRSVSVSSSSPDIDGQGGRIAHRPTHRKCCPDRGSAIMRRLLERTMLHRCYWTPAQCFSAR